MALFIYALRILGTIQLDGTKLTEVYELPSTTFSISWSPDGKFIQTDVYGGSLGIVNVKDSDHKIFDDIPGMGASWLDSEHITYSSNDSIYVLNRLTGESNTLGAGTFPNVSPDKNKIAYIKSNNLHVMNTDGTQTRVIADSAEGTNLAWSPNSRHIAFLRAGSLWSINFENDQKKQLTGDNAVGEGAWRPVSWASDGSKLVYMHSAATGGPYRIGVVKADGTDNQVISDNDITSVRWFPDKDRNVILYRSGSTGNLMKINPDGSNPAEITAMDGLVFNISPIPIRMN